MIAAQTPPEHRPGPMTDPPPCYYEFFAGGGMVSAALAPAWRCLYANDFDAKKNAAYRANWPTHPLDPRDIHEVAIHDLPGRAELAWASFPCQDLSLAGSRSGLAGSRSSAFWPFHRLIGELKAHGRAPPIVALENVVGALSSHNGADFQAIARAFANLDYYFGALIVDAAFFTPQSRPRLFLIAVSAQPRAAAAPGPASPWHGKPILSAYAALPLDLKLRWIWWAPPLPPAPAPKLAEIVEPAAARAWHTPDQTAALIAKMSEANLAKLAALENGAVGALYKRTRPDKNGGKAQRAELRVDGLAGCLRTPAGGSSRQTLVFSHNGVVSSRLISARETARLMGLPDAYILPARYNEAYHLTGDGVVVPAVAHLARHIFIPLIEANPTPLTAKALSLAANSV